MYDPRGANSGYRKTPERVGYSPGYSDASFDPKSTPGRRSAISAAASYSPGYSDASFDPKSTPGRRSAVSAAARSFAGVFIACFTPSDTSSSESVSVFEQVKVPSVVSETYSRDGSERSRGSNRGNNLNSNNSVQGKVPGNVSFTIKDICQATRNFSPSFKIGQGGFGTVYKGRLPDGSLVAIKRGKKSVYDKHLGVEFQSEVHALSQVEHLNLVKYYGYLEHEDERILIIEYVPNGTLREHLDCMHGEVLDLAARLDIAIDVAHAITYLHMYADHPIIHRDIKSSNILLTENFRAKVADFGFAKLLSDSDLGATHVSTQVKGTAGYLDPEYLKTYQLTEKSDVYSFGVLLVELVTGRRPIEPKLKLKERITAKWAMKKFVDGDAIMVLDPRIQRNAANILVLEKILELALQCLAPRRQQRISMKKCAEILWAIRRDYRELSASDFRTFSSSSQRSSSLPH